MLVDVAVTDDRKQIFDFNTQTALLSWSIIYAKSGVNFASFKDLDGKSIAIIKSSVHYTGPLGLKNVLTSFGINATIVDVPTMSDALKMIEAGTVDAGVVNWHFGIANEDKYKVSRTGLIFNPNENNFAFTKGSPKSAYLISVMDYYLRALKDDPNSIYYDSLKTNFGKSIGQVEVIPSWLKYLIIGIISFGIFAIIVFLLMRQYQRTLKRQIEEKVRDIRESEEKYSAVVNQAHDAIIIVQDGIVKYVNKAINIVGYNNEE